MAQLNIGFSWIGHWIRQCDNTNCCRKYMRVEFVSLLGGRHNQNTRRRVYIIWLFGIFCNFALICWKGMRVRSLAYNIFDEGQRKHNMYSCRPFLRLLSTRVRSQYKQIKTVFLATETPMIKIRRSSDRLIFIMGMFKLVRRHHYIEMGFGLSVFSHGHTTSWNVFGDKCGRKSLDVNGPCACVHGIHPIYTIIMAYY